GFRMGVAGAAIATVAAQTVSAVLVVLHLMRLNPVYRFRPLHMTFDRLAAWDILRISIPCGLQGSMFNISNLLVQAKFNSFGMVAVAGISAYNKIDGFIYMPIFALSFSVSTYVGQNIGAAKFDRIRKGVRLCVILSAAIGIVMGGLILLFCDPLLALFTDDAAAKTYALQMMRFMAPFAWIFAFSDILGGAIRGAGQALQVTVISALCVCAFRILWLFIGLALLHDIRIVFLCYPISWALSSAVMTLFYFKGSRLMRTVKSQTAAVTQT
ncbi:MAG: MATE family efflux transporter, partial [Oscillospiraceae bacterium]|nr:MATE family efflux transporter [Oscillospiraceae bacterium]